MIATMITMTMMSAGAADEVDWGGPTGGAPAIGCGPGGGGGPATGAGWPGATAAPQEIQKASPELKGTPQLMQN